MMTCPFYVVKSQDISASIDDEDYFELMMRCVAQHARVCVCFLWWFAKP